MGDRHFVITRLNQTMVATLEGAVDAGELGDLVDSLSEAQARQNVNSVVLDVSACEVMDLDEFAELQRAVRTAEWLGLRWNRSLYRFDWGRIGNVTHGAGPGARAGGAKR